MPNKAPNKVKVTRRPSPIGWGGFDAEGHIDSDGDLEYVEYGKDGRKRTALYGSEGCYLVERCDGAE